jgi:uncharacterized OsmC-like protein
VEGVRKRKAGSDAKFLFGAERVNIAYLGKEFSAKKVEFIIPIDESADRGGTNHRPNPLANFLTGCASCLMMRNVRLAFASKISIERFELSAQSHFDRRIALAKEAERICYVHSTLLRAGVKLRTNLKLDGKQSPRQNPVWHDRF